MTGSAGSARRVVVTGANRGLGLAVAEKLLRAGWDVTLTSRNADEGRAAVDKLQRATGKDAELLPLDLTDRRSIETLASILVERAARGLPLDLLVQNAGLLGGDGAAVVDTRLVQSGCERTLATNALGPFLLARLLLPAFKGSLAPRIVFVGSRTHLRVKALGLDDVDGRSIDGSKRYARSKLVLLWLARALARRTPIPVHVVCPGLVPETAAPRTTGLSHFLMKHVLPRFSFSRTLDEGASGIAWAATEPALQGKTGLFLADQRELPASALASDEARQEAMWTRACAMLQISPDVLDTGTG